MKNSIDRRQFLQRLGFLTAGLMAGCRTAKSGWSFALPKDSLLEKYQLEFALTGHLEAYALHTCGMGKGTCSIDCSDKELHPDQRVKWVQVVYTAPAEGLVRGGSVTLAVPPGPAESAVQLDNPAKPAFMKISSARPFTSTLKYPPFEVQENCPVRRSLVEVLLPEGLPAGDTVTFTWHDVRLDIHARRWDGDSWRFHLYADHDGDGWGEELPQIATVPKKSAPVDHLLIRCSSMALPGEPVRINVAAFDRFGNPAQDYSGEVRFTFENSGSGTLPRPYRFVPDDRSAHVFSATFEKTGFYWLTVIDDQGRSCRSNPVEILAEEPAHRLYWGDLHVHTEKSADARVWAHTTSTYDGSYNIGRCRYGLDFQANTDHHGLLQGNYTKEEWVEMKRMTNAANDPGRFVALIANEFSHPQGDANAYFKEDDVPYFDHEPYESAKYPERLFAQLHSYHCPLIPHHTAQNMRPFNWNNYDPALMSVCEIFSNHGRTEYLHNQPHYSNKKIPTLKDHTWVEQLQTDKKMGCIASSDDHWARPGTCGLTGVWSPSFDRKGICDAVYNRHCYATTGDRTILYFSVNGAETGQTIPSAEKAHIRVRAAAGSIIDKLEIVKNGEVIYTSKPGELTADETWTDLSESDSCWYYVRLTLRAQDVCEEYMRGKAQFVWSSPVWVEAAI